MSTQSRAQTAGGPGATGSGGSRGPGGSPALGTSSLIHTMKQAELVRISVIRHDISHFWNKTLCCAVRDATFCYRCHTGWPEGARSCRRSAACGWFAPTQLNGAPVLYRKPKGPKPRPCFQTASPSHPRACTVTTTVFSQTGVEGAWSSLNALAPFPASCSSLGIGRRTCGNAHTSRFVSSVCGQRVHCIDVSRVNA